MADNTTSSDPTSWAGLGAFINHIYGTGTSTGETTQTSLQKIAQGMMGKAPTQHKANTQLAPPPFQNGVVGGPMGGSGGPFANGAVGGPLQGLPHTGILPPQQIAQPVSATGQPHMIQPAPTMTSPVVGLPSLTNPLPATADHFITGTPNPSGSQVA